MELLKKGLIKKMRLIDADRLNKPLYAEEDNITGSGMSYDEICGYNDGIDIAWNKIDQAPTIDAVPVVRCKDCKQGEVDDPAFPDQYYCHAGCGWSNGNFYCAYGERKEGAE